MGGDEQLQGLAKGKVQALVLRDEPSVGVGRIVVVEVNDSRRNSNVIVFCLGKVQM